MSPVVHGGIDPAELAALGLRPDNVLDFSSNLNPYGPPAAVRRALSALDPAPYPDRHCHALRHALAQHYACPPEAVLVGNGAAEVIHLIARALLSVGDRVLVIEPTFGEYAWASRLYGADVTALTTHAGDHFAINVPDLLATIERQRPRIVWLCSPNNPTGTSLDPAALQAVADACASANTYLALDQAYAAMQRHRSAPVHLPFATSDPHVLHLHSLTKTYALAGLRLGCLIARPDLVARIGMFQPAWSVNSAAQVAGIAALADESFVDDTLLLLWSSSDILRYDLRALGLDVLPSTLPFFLVHTGDGAHTRAALLSEGCLVRDCASFGLPAYVRVAPRTPSDNQRLLDAWRKL